VEECRCGRHFENFGERSDSGAASSGFLVEIEKVCQALRDFSVRSRSGTGSSGF
jgi:hypothetical protein